MNDPDEAVDEGSSTALRYGPAIAADENLGRLPLDSTVIVGVQQRSESAEDEVLVLELNDGCTIHIEGSVLGSATAIESMAFFAANGAFVMEERITSDGYSRTFAGGDSVELVQVNAGIELRMILNGTVPPSTVTFLVHTDGSIVLDEESVKIGEL